MELLAPAGSMDALKAAAANGADAVYLGGDRFNARQAACNFPEERLKEALEYAGERGIKVYVTLNTLVKDIEMDEVLQFAGFIYEQGADAAIVQDIGLAYLLRRHFPDLRLHASTQMTVMNTSGVRFCEEAGMSRVVLARELSLGEIEAIARSSEAEIEVFVHGALCVCYSGQCLLSGYIGGRSGNRGKCAQPCRLPWRVETAGRRISEESYLLSTRDLMGLNLLPQFKDAGVSSLKIEGRMKSAEYVAAVTGIYRKYIDLLEAVGRDGYAVENQDIEKLLQIFNRGGFTSGYLEGSANYSTLIYPKHPKNRGVRLGRVLESGGDAIKVLLEKPLHMGDGIEVWDMKKGVPDIIVSSILLDGKHVRTAPAGSAPWVGDMKLRVEKGSEVWRTYSKSLMAEATASYADGEKRRIGVRARFGMRVGEPAVLELTDADGNNVTVLSGQNAEKAENKALSPERISAQIMKTGDMPYRIDAVDVDTDGISTLPISALNAMRREALESLREKRISRIKRFRGGGTEPHYDIERFPAASCPQSAAENRSVAQSRPLRHPSLSAFFYGKPVLPADFHKYVGRIYVPLMERNEAAALRGEFPGEIYCWTPNVAKDGEFPEMEADIRGLQDFIDGVSAANAGVLRTLAESFPGIGIHADFPMNVFNSAAIEVLARYGVSSVTISPELTYDEADNIIPGSLLTETVLYGRVPLMTLECCPSGAIAGCSGSCGACPASSGFLTDRRGTVFPYVRGGRFRRTYLMSPAPIFTDNSPHLKKSGGNLCRLSFTDEGREVVDVVARWFHGKLTGHEQALDAAERAMLEEMRGNGGRGYWAKGV
jgi:putative protease